MFKSMPKQRALDAYAVVIKAERVKMHKAASSKKKRGSDKINVSSDGSSEEESVKSHGCMELVPILKKKKSVTIPYKTVVAKCNKSIIKHKPIVQR